MSTHLWTLDKVRAALHRPKPGEKAQLIMATQPRSLRDEWPEAGPPRQSAVLILLYPILDQLHLVLTLRTETVAHHKGQVSLPGGGWEAGDRTLADTALREAEEELGISLDDAELLSGLTSLYIPASNFDIHPYVAYLPRQPRFAPCLDEVAELLEVPLSTLLDPSLRQSEARIIRQREAQVPYFLLCGHKVWGATAMILVEFAAALADYEADPSSGQGEQSACHEEP